MSLNSIAYHQISKSPEAKAAAAAQPANRFKMLTKYIPTEVITLYTAAMAIKNQYGAKIPVGTDLIYWFCAVVLTPGILILIMLGNKRKDPSYPRLFGEQSIYWEISASIIAFLAWAVAVPGGPYLQSEVGSVIAGFAALFISMLLSLCDPIFIKQN